MAIGEFNALIRNANGEVERSNELFKKLMSSIKEALAGQNLSEMGFEYLSIGDGDEGFTCLGHSFLFNHSYDHRGDTPFKTTVTIYYMRQLGLDEFFKVNELKYEGVEIGAVQYDNSGHVEGIVIGDTPLWYIDNAASPKTLYITEWLSKSVAQQFLPALE